MNRRAFLRESACLLVLTGTVSRAAQAAGKAGAHQPQGPSAANAAMDPAALSAAQLRLGQALLARLSSGPSPAPNLVLSPASLVAVLSLIEMGASDGMSEALYQTLGFERISTGGIRTAFEGLRKLARTAAPDIKGPLKLANMIVFDPTTRPLVSALEKLAGTSADVSVENLRAPGALDKINNWSREKTEGMIPKVLDDVSQAGLVAVNALYFKDSWKTRFDPSNTKAQPFYPANGTPAQVQMMNLAESHLAFRQSEKFIAVELPYATDRYRMVIATTKTAPAEAADFQAISEWMGGEGFDQSGGHLSLPRFSLSVSVDLLDPLDHLGLSPARHDFDSFKGLSLAAQTIAKVAQSTELRVSEEGTEAAAATATATVRSVAPPPITMVVDRPFTFALRDISSGLIVLQGYVGALSD
jgi:serine protease inhibitor